MAVVPPPSIDAEDTIFGDGATSLELRNNSRLISPLSSIKWRTLASSLAMATISDDDYDKYVEGKFDEIMPWIGFYITAASAVCTAAMAADAVRGFRHRKLWFPCKYFSLNALSLTLLAVAMKLSQDVNTNLSHNFDIKFAKLANLPFISAAMANFMPSMGSMKDKELAANLVALGIMVITFLANALIETIQLQGSYFEIIYLFYIPAMLHLILALVASAVSLPTVKTDLESKYQEKHKVALMADEVVPRNDRQDMMKYWVMAETCNPQFVLARSVVCTTPVLIHLFPTIIFLLIIFLDIKGDPLFIPTLTSVYGRFTSWILVIQTSGIIVGLIAPTSRWFIAMGFKCLPSNQYSFKKELKIENHWIQTLVDYRDTFSALETRQHKIMGRCLHSAKWCVFTFCIGIQILIVMSSKLLALVPVLLLRSIFMCVTHTNKFMIETWQLFSNVSTSDNHRNSNDESYGINLRSYALRLDGEAKLPTWIVKGMCRRANDVIHLGRKKQPMNLIHLLNRFDNFSGVKLFDTVQVPSLHSQEPLNCWTLSIVTLASIAITLPNIANDKKRRLLSSVGEGLSLAKIVEKDLDKNAQPVNITKAADVSWVGVALYKKWLDVDLEKTSLMCKNSEEVLHQLSKKGENTVRKFKREMVDTLLENPHNWPVNVVASNSMYRISQTILLSFELDNEQTDEELFERLSYMIAGILAACFTNLAHIIRTMCHHNAIEKREEYVHEAFLLLGKTEQILELLHRHEWPSLDHDKASYIDEWRHFFSQNQDGPTDSTSTSSTSTSSSNETVATRESNEEILVVTVDA